MELEREIIKWPTRLTFFQSMNFFSKNEIKNWIGRNSLKTNQICDWTTLRFWVLKLLVKVACKWWLLNFFVFSFTKDDDNGGLMVSKELYGWWKCECVFFSLWFCYWCWRIWGWRWKGISQIKVEVIKIMLVYVLECCVCRLCCWNAMFGPCNKDNWINFF